MSCFPAWVCISTPGELTGKWGAQRHPKDSTLGELSWGFGICLWSPPPRVILLQEIQRSTVQIRIETQTADVIWGLPCQVSWSGTEARGREVISMFYSILLGSFTMQLKVTPSTPPPHLQPGMVWIDLFRDASVTSPDQKPGTKISSGLLDSFWVLVDTFVIVCVHACVHTGTHSHASAITHHFLNLINYIFRQDILKVSFLAHFALLLTLSWPSPPATSLDFLKQMLCHQLSEVLQSVISLQPHAPIISMDRWVSFRDLT